jgi:tRNA pseudouridine55 synthase
MPSGFLLIDKPTGFTSFRALSPAKRVFHTKRVGHAGTLDQRASGLLVLATERATRLLPYIEAQEKLYSFTLHLGRLTDTLEFDGETVESDTNAARSRAQVEAALPQFLGRIAQVPPAYSAIKIEGKRASDLTLRGKTVELAPRSIEIFELSVTGESDPCTYTLLCRCSKGTYIRSLCRDLGSALGTFGSASGIRRLAIGGLRVENAVCPDALTEADLHPVTDLLPWPVVDAEEAEMERLVHGIAVPCGDAIDAETKCFVRDPGGEVRLVAQIQGEMIAPKILL